jgi:hypothetical protein
MSERTENGMTYTFPEIAAALQKTEKRLGSIEEAVKCLPDMQAALIRMESTLYATSARVHRLDRERELPVELMHKVRADVDRVSDELTAMRKRSTDAEASGQHDVLMDLAVDVVKEARQSRAELAREERSERAERVRRRWQIAVVVATALATVGTSYAAARLGIQATPPPAAKEAK